MGSAEQPALLPSLQSGDVDQSTLQFIAEGVTELARFDLAAISIVHDGRLHAVAIAGHQHAQAEISRLHPPVSVVLEELAGAEDWGALKFVPHDRDTPRLDEYSYVPEYEPVEAPNAWHPRDLLVALLEDDSGELRGVLSVDVPRDGLRPDTEQRRVLEVYARQAGRAVITLLERRELEQGLRRSQATSDYRRQLIDVVAHQLQNPVAAILGNLEMLLDDLPPGDPRERPLRGIERAAGRIEAMAQDLLALVKVNNPERPLHEEDVDLGVLVAEVAEAFAAELAGRGIDLRLDRPDAPLVVRGDPGELEDLVGNLVSNAIKYSDRGGAVVVALESLPVGGEPHAVLRVEDSGIGIAAADLDHLFQEFFRSEAGAARSRPGTGLGLAVVERVAHRHGGSVEVQSELGVGTTFRVLLPLR